MCDRVDAVPGVKEDVSRIISSLLDIFSCFKSIKVSLLACYQHSLVRNSLLECGNSIFYGVCTCVRLVYNLRTVINLSIFLRVNLCEAEGWCPCSIRKELHWSRSAIEVKLERLSGDRDECERVAEVVHLINYRLNDVDGFYTQEFTR